MEHDNDFAMDLVGKRVAFQNDHCGITTSELVTRAILKDKDILLGLENGEHILFSKTQLIPDRCAA